MNARENVNIYQSANLTDNSLYILLGAALAIRSEAMYRIGQDLLQNAFSFGFEQSSETKFQLVLNLIESAFLGAFLRGKDEVAI